MVLIPPGESVPLQIAVVCSNPRLLVMRKMMQVRYKPKGHVLHVTFTGMSLVCILRTHTQGLEFSSFPP